MAVQLAIDALRAGRPVLLPTDTVYGLCASLDEAPARTLAELKGRDPAKPMGVIFASVEAALAHIPELDARILEALLPGSYTLVLSNPARRYAWLNPARPEAIGVRVARLPAETQQVLDAVGAVIATSANTTGGPEPTRLDQIPPAIRAACGAEIDAGPLLDKASTVLDLTGPEPVVLREGAADSAEAISIVRRVSTIE